MTQITRRTFGTGLLALGMAGCSAPETRATMSVASLPTDLQPSRNAGYDRWVADFKSRASQQGYSTGLLDEAFRGTGYLPGVVSRDRNQVEFRRSLEDYLSIAVSDERVSRGRAAFAQNAQTLKAIEQRYGVDAYIVTAIWGLESFYGDRRGEVPVISATSTLAYDGRRGRFFEQQLIAALDILQNGDIPARDMTGSWAGAMGHTQFIPTSYLAFAVDFTGDGRRDIWSDDPTDALASAAAYLNRNGWRSGVRWGREDTGGSLQPQAGGPRFSVSENFNVIKRYNNSDSYAIGVGHLADRIAGGPPLRAPFPPDANGLTKDDRIALQEGLTQAGFDTGGADGVIGPNTQNAIRGYQRSQGLPETGEPSRSLLERIL
ncbi:MAG: lytic murein transglycosylase [Dinoroseobacter sp.]|nr:lytic murein transglycosylase [Dinoroseobacter sp.]